MKLSVNGYITNDLQQKVKKKEIQNCNVQIGHCKYD